MKQKLIITCLIWLLFSFGAYSQDTTFAGKAVAALKSFLSNYPAEKAYLHFDKPYYAAGDTLYFKAYVTMGQRHEPSQISGILHVDLINTQNKIDQSLLLDVTGGIGKGDFALPDSLPKGIYRVRAYTDWMRNNGETGFFYKAIAVGSLLDNKVSESADRNQQQISGKPEIQFLPEGGRLVSGIKSKIAFKAIGSNGLGIAAKGKITDDTGKTITSFTSAHLGMGWFYLQPEEGKCYSASLTFGDGTQNTINLPDAEKFGVTLTANNDSIQKTSVVITANNGAYVQNKGKDYSLLIYSGGVATTVTTPLDSPVIKFDIAKHRLHTGVATLTLFSPGGEPLSERLFFVQNYDEIRLAVNSDKATYVAREKVIVKINAKSRADSLIAGNFSVSVTDESKVPVDENAENSILSNLLLTSDLKGNIEQPNYYFTNITDEKLKELDLVMLTHGYRQFEWKQLLNNGYPPVTWQPETGLEISGIAKTKDGKPLAKGLVSLMSSNGHSFLSEQTDNNGNFRFKNLAFGDTTNFILQAATAKGNNSTQLTYTTKPAPPVLTDNRQMVQDNNEPMSLYLKNTEKQQEQLNMQGLGKGTMLNEVKIKARKSDPSVTSIRYGFPDYVLHGKEIGPGSQLAFKLMGRIPGVLIMIVPGSGSHYTAVLGKNISVGVPMKIIVDEREMRADFDLNSLSASRIDKIESITGGVGVLLITTKYGLQPEDIISTGFLAIKANGLYKAREFYSPKYESTISSKFADLRITIFWKPEVITDKYGNASFEYFNADGKGDYRVVVEGIDDKGNLGRQVYRYKVQ
ncbi:hypothetical protein [Mucilaginibacter xinganensis]|uniref:MG2 domain-containing protein n=1 Tax=Mucilaginibacter xinganensis TaxID=1234841 RepID=A0A223P3Q8_9SPHI|nr:hypothetical protein [Mucilaginibacter xinganensis]ASU36488.1 hypothetical protein MuYL_4605 [Mucilaginibacter xinganensis]